MKNAITREDLEWIRELLPEQEGYYSNVVINHVDYQRILCFFARMEDALTRAEAAEAKLARAIALIQAQDRLLAAYRVGNHKWAEEAIDAIKPLKAALAAELEVE